MKVPPPVTSLLDWVASGQQRLEEAVAALDPAAVHAPSALAGWTRGHVITHLARNADALINLLDWARTATPTPMYSSPEQRNGDIEAGAPRGLDEQAADLRASGRRFAEAAAALPDECWSARVTSAQGRDIAAAEVPWMRVREVWIHLVDLDVGVGMEVLPDEVAVALVREVAAWMAAKVDRVVELRPDGCDRVLLGPHGAEPTAVVAGSPNQLAGWLTGRTTARELQVTGTVPELLRWL